MKIYTLMENTACDEKFSFAHGLSFFIESGGQRIVFDTGPDGKFAENAELLNVKLSSADFAFLSHGHYDHGGGLRTFMDINPSAPVYISPGAFGQYYNGKGSYIGLDQSLKGNSRFVTLREESVIGNARLCPAFSGLSHPLNRAGLREKSGEELIPDSFMHEQYLLINDEGRRILFSGCSHRGILNITEHFKPDILIGGFHFMKEELPEGGNPMLDQAAEELLSFNTEYYTCHCTGLPQYKYLKERMGERLHYLSAGSVIRL